MQILASGRRIGVGLLVLLAAIAVQSASAQQTVVHLDPAQTQITYVVDSVLHTVHGTFALKSGEIRYDPATGAASGAVVIDATTGESGGDARDKRMHKEILESEKYPEITFTAKRVTGKAAQGSSQLQVEGTFRLHGADHPLTLTVPLEISGSKLTATTSFDVPYVQWGLKNPSTFVLRVNKVVKIEIKTTGQLSPAK